MAHTVREDKPQKNVSGYASPFMVYLVGVSLTVGAVALPLSNFSSRPITPSLSCQLSVFISAKLRLKKRKKAREAVEKVNCAPSPGVVKL